MGSNGLTKPVMFLLNYPEIHFQYWGVIDTYFSIVKIIVNLNKGTLSHRRVW